MFLIDSYALKTLGAYFYWPVVASEFINILATKQIKDPIAHSSPTFVADRNGTGASALQFNNVGDYFTVDRSFTPGNGQLAPRTFAFWVKAQTPSAKLATMVYYYYGGNTRFSIFQYGSHVDYQGVFVYTYYQGVSYYIYSDALLDANSWDRFVLVLEAGRMKFYKNGVRQPAANPGLPVNLGVKTIFFGCAKTCTSTEQFIGDLDEIIIFSKSLTDQEVANDYNLYKSYLTAIN